MARNAAIGETRSNATSVASGKANSRVMPLICRERMKPATSMSW